jgi:hypothetical protein
MDLGRGTLRFSRNGVHLGEAFTGVTGPLVAAVTLASEESKVTIQNRPTVLNMGEYTGELGGRRWRWQEHFETRMGRGGQHGCVYVAVRCTSDVVPRADPAKLASNPVDSYTQLC